MPLYGKLKEDLNKILFLNTSKYLTIDLLENFIDFDHPDKNEHAIAISVTSVPLNLEPGSQDSLDFLNLVIHSINDEAFYTKFSNLVQYKWHKEKWILEYIAFKHLLYVFLIDIHALHIKEQKWQAREKTLVSFLFIQTLILWVYEFVQFKFGQTFDYIFDVQNWLDFIGQGCIWIYCFMRFSDTQGDYTR